MICKWCGYNNQDSSIYCEHCNNIIKEQNFHETLGDMRKNGVQQSNGPQSNYNYDIEEDAFDFQNRLQGHFVYHEPKKKMNFKLIGTSLFIFLLFSFFVFSTVIFFNTKLEEKEKLNILNSIPLEKEETENNEDEYTSIETESYDSSIPKDIEYIEETTTQEIINQETITENIENKTTEDKSVEIENEIFPNNTGVSFYGLVNLKIPIKYSTINPILYEQTTYSFWETSTMTMFNVGYENTDETRHIYETCVLPYKDVWSLPENKDSLETISFNNYFTYYVDGYNQELDLYSRTFFITNIKSIVNENGIVVPITELDKTGEYIVLSFTYNQENANKMSKLMEYTCMNGKTKFHQNVE